MKRVGKKILATGNGRCNFANKHFDISRFHGIEPEFVKNVFEHFGLDSTINFFEELGIAWYEEEKGKIYPQSNQAASILNILRYEIKRKGVKEICNLQVVSIKKQNSIFEIQSKQNSTFYSKKVILATGGKAAPYLGSNGSGYDLVREFGHSVIKPEPALVPVKLDAHFIKSLKGVKIKGKVRLTIKNKVLQEERGEILFTNYGISGLPVLQVSRKINVNKNQNLFTTLDFFPEQKIEELRRILMHRFKKLHYKNIGDSLEGFINKRLTREILKFINVDFKKLSGKISQKEIEKIISILKSWKLKVKGTKSWRDAQVTAGGISTLEINPKTLESKIVKGLFFAGEILDIDGDSGGFNLQWAWSSGFIAAENAAKDKIEFK